VFLWKHSSGKKGFFAPFEGASSYHVLWAWSVILGPMGAPNIQNRVLPNHGEKGLVNGNETLVLEKINFLDAFFHNTLEVDAPLCKP